MRRQCPKQTVVGNRQRRNKLRELLDPLLRVYKVYATLPQGLERAQKRRGVSHTDDGQEPKMKVVREDAGRQFPQETLQKPSDRVRVPVFVGAYKINVPFYVKMKR